MYYSAKEDGISSSYKNGCLTFIMCALHIPGISRQKEFGCGGKSLHRKPRPGKSLFYSDMSGKFARLMF